VGQETVTVALSAEHFKEMKQAVQDARRLRKTIRAMEVLSRYILFATTSDTQRFKPIKINGLRLL
jgi:HJR/Mrr/RecB family endonuclease